MFRLVGAQADSESSKKNKRNSVMRFNIFLQAKGMKDFQHLETHELTIELMQEYAGYSCEAAEKVDGEPFAWETISKFITGVKTSCLKDPRFKDMPIWKDDDWYAKIRSRFSDGIPGNTFLLLFFINAPIFAEKCVFEIADNETT